MTKAKLNKEQLLEIASRYYKGETYKSLKADGITRRQIINAQKTAEKQWNISSKHLNVRQLVSLAHRQKGYVTEAQVRKYTSWVNPAHKKYKVVYHSIEDMSEFYGDEAYEEVVAKGGYTPIVLQGM